MTERPRAAARGVETLFAGMRGRLLALVLAGAVPVIGIALNNALVEHRAALTEMGRSVVLLREAQVARQVVVLDNLEGLLRGLTADDRFLRQSPDACEAALRDMERLFPRSYTGFWVLEPDGRLRCASVAVARGRSFADQDYFAAVRARGDFAMGGFIAGPVTGARVLQAAAPLPGGAMVGAALRLDWLARRSDADEAPHVAWLFDADGRTLPLGESAEASLPTPDVLRALLAAPRDSTVSGTARGGDRMVWSAAPVAGGLRLAVGLPAEEVLNSAQSQLHRRLAELALFVLTCMLAIIAGAELTCSRPLRRLVRQVENWRPGKPLGGEPSAWDPWEVRALNATLCEASVAMEQNRASLAAALRQRELMIEELHHRVKNNLQIVASLINLQAGRAGEEVVRQEFVVARERVQALAALHRHMRVEGEAAVVPLAPLLLEMCGSFVRALRAEGGLAVEVSAAPLTLPAEQAASFTLFVSEALTNAVRHGFPHGRAGQITVQLSVAAGEATLGVSDDGVGASADIAKADGVGLSLMRGFAAHLEGNFEVTAGPSGTLVRLRFPVPEELAQAAQ